MREDQMSTARMRHYQSSAVNNDQLLRNMAKGMAQLQKAGGEERAEEFGDAAADQSFAGQMRARNSVSSVGSSAPQVSKIPTIGAKKTSSPGPQRPSKLGAGAVVTAARAADSKAVSKPGAKSQIRRTPQTNSTTEARRVPSMR